VKWCVALTNGAMTYAACGFPPEVRLEPLESWAGEE